MKNDHAFLFLSGSGGCFLKGIFYYYQLIKIGKNKPEELVVDKITGDCHGMLTGEHYHQFDEIIKIKKQSPETKVVVISVDPDDLDIIAKMSFHKLKNTEFNDDKATDQVSIKQKIWNDSIDYSQVDLCVKFKTIIGTSDENLNHLIADYFDMEPLLVVNEFINLYRDINTKLYISST